MSAAIRDIAPLGFAWETFDPFLVCVHHVDAYPRGDEALGPAASLEGRQLGQDFEGLGGWRMYHGRTVPGFPQHPHRGFETVTVMRSGFIDHADSLGAAARYGPGDVQWLTAGAGVVHSEMFPLLKRDAPNPLELFQIWLNLPAADKLAPPHFSMLWADALPRLERRDARGLRSEVLVVAGAWEGHAPPRPPPASWASHAEAEVAIWLITLAPGATLTLPSATGAQTARGLFVYGTGSVTVDGEAVPTRHSARVDARAAVKLAAPGEEASVLVLQGRPIGEPVAQHGPFVMNTRAELVATFEDYRRTGFGGWPWRRDDPVHPRDEGRFARHADGRVERPASELAASPGAQPVKSD